MFGMHYLSTRTRILCVDGERGNRSISNSIHFSCVVCLYVHSLAAKIGQPMYLFIFYVHCNNNINTEIREKKCQQWLQKSGGEYVYQLSIDLQIFWRLTLPDFSCLAGRNSNEIYFIELTFRILFFCALHTNERIKKSIKNLSRHCIFILIEFIGSFHAFLSTTNLCVFDK